MMEAYLLTGRRNLPLAAIVFVAEVVAGAALGLFIVILLKLEFDPPDRIGIWWVQPLITATAAIFAGGFAMLTIAANRKIARTRASLDLVEKLESQEFYRKNWSTFRTVRRAFRLAELREKPDDDEEKLSVLNALNHFELIAVGCDVGVLDREFYFKYMGRPLIRDWLAARDLVFFLRYIDDERDVTTYERYESLVRSWMTTEELHEDRKWWSAKIRDLNSNGSSAIAAAELAGKLE